MQATPVIVVRESDQQIIAHCTTVAEAEDFIHMLWIVEPELVESGAFVIDGPAEFF